MSDAQQPPPLRLRPRLQASEPAAASTDAKSAVPAPQPANDSEKPAVGSEGAPSPESSPAPQATPADNLPPPADTTPIKLKLKAKPSLSAMPPPLLAPAPAEAPAPVPEAAKAPLPSIPPLIPVATVVAKPVESAPPPPPPPPPVIPPPPAPSAPPPVVAAPIATTIPPSPPQAETPPAESSFPRPPSAQRPGGGGPIPRPPVRPPHIQPSRAAAGSGSLRTGYQPQQPTERKSFKIGATMALLAGLLLIVGITYLGYFFLIKEDPKPAPVTKPAATQAKPAAAATDIAAAQPKPAEHPATKPAVGDATASTPAKPAETVATPVTPTPAGAQPKPTELIQTSSTIISPKTPIDRAQQVIAKHRAVEQGRIDLAIDGSTPTDVPLQANAEPAKPKGRPTFSEISPGISATNRDIAATPQANSNFRRFVGDMVIRGVFQGAHPRAHINGRMVSQGEMVERNLGIVFESIDSDKKTITFRDGNGAVITRRY